MKCAIRMSVCPLLQRPRLEVTPSQVSAQVTEIRSRDVGALIHGTHVFQCTCKVPANLWPLSLYYQYHTESHNISSMSQSAREDLEIGNNAGMCYLFL
jgi:hypothetical protein